MKTKLKRIIIALLCIIIISITSYYIGLFSRFNFIRAYYDIITKNYCIASIGELGIHEPQEMYIAPKLGFDIDRTYGCNVNTGIINGANHYNIIMGAYIEKHICKDWHTKLTQYANEIYMNDSIAFSIVTNDSLMLKRNDIPKNTIVNFGIDERDSLIYKLSGYGYNDSLQKSFKYFELNVDLKSKKIKGVKYFNLEIKEK